MERTLQSQNLLVRMHNCRVGSDRSTEDIVRVREVNDDDLVLFIDPLSHTDEMVALKGQGL